MTYCQSASKERVDNACSRHKKSRPGRRPFGYIRVDQPCGLSLAGFEPALRLVDNIHTTLAAHDATVAVTLLERAEGISDLHGPSPFSRRVPAPLGFKIMVGTTGIEPVTPSMSTKCSTAELSAHDTVSHTYQVPKTKGTRNASRQVWGL